MKARQMASSLNSVYAVSPSGQVLQIERGPDGFWSWWRATGTNAKRIAHGGSVLASIGLDDRVSALQRYPADSWFTWDRTATEVCAAHIPGRGPALFAADEQALWHTSKEAPSSPWREWEPLEWGSLGGPLANIDATAVPGGGAAVFGIRDGAVHHRWEEGRSSAWREWTGLGGPPGGARTVCADTINDGGLVVFTIGGDDAVYHRWQAKPFDRWHPWESLGGAVKSLSVAKAPTGGLAVFAIGLDDRVSCRYQERRFGEWSAWVELGGEALSLSAQASFTDGLEVFAVGLDDEVYHTWCESVGWPWQEWTLLDYETSPLRVALGGLPRRVR